MIWSAIKDEEIALSIRKKEIYHHLANLCERWDGVVDICNGKHGPYSPENIAERDDHLLSTLDWFLKQKILHNKNVVKGDASEFNFFADETWFCIRALILAHVGTIQIYCIEKRVCINPRCMNTDAVEWFLVMLVK